MIRARTVAILAKSSNACILDRLHNDRRYRNCMAVERYVDGGDGDGMVAGETSGATTA